MSKKVDATGSMLSPVVTEQKQSKGALEDSEELYRSMIELSPDSIVAADLKGVILQCNAAAARISGYSKEELVGKHFSKLRAIRVRDMPKYLNAFSSILRGEAHKPFELTFYRPDGTTTLVETRVNLLKVGGRRIIQATTRDITERKRMEQSLHLQNEFLNNILDSLSHPFYVINASDYTIKLANQAAKMGNLSANPTCYALTHKSSKPCRGADHVCPLEEVKKTKKPVVVEHIHYDADGNPRNMEVHGYPVFDTEGNVIQMIEYSLDITERKRAEEMLRKSEEKYKGLVNNVKLGILRSTLGPPGRVLEANPAMEEITGYSREELLAMDMEEFYVHLEERESILEELAMTREAVTRELRWRKKNGSEIVVLVKVIAVRDDAGKILYLDAIFEDITERKRMEHALEERLKEFNCLYGIAEIAQRQGLTLDEIYQEVANLLPQSWQYPEITGARIRVDDREFKTENYRETEWKQCSDIIVHGAKVGVVEVSYLEERPVLDEGPFLKEERLLIDAVAERLGRITERKRAEEELRESREKLQHMFESVTDGITVSNQNGIITGANNRVAKIHGYDNVEELIGRNGFELIAPHDRERAMANLQKTLKEGIVRGIEYSFLRRDGSEFPAELSAGILKDASGNPAGFIAVTRDITERKRAEEEMRVKDSAIATSINAIAIADLEGSLTYVNPAFLKTWGYDDEKEVLGKTVMEFWQMEEKAQEIVEALHNTGGWRGELTATRKDGAIFDTQLSASMVTDEKGKPICLMATFIDITERKRAEEELKSSEERLKILFEFAPDAYYLNDLKGDFIDGNKLAEEITGYKKDELIGKSFLKLKLLSVKQIPKAAALLARNALGKATGPDEFILNRKDGNQVPVEIRTFSVKIKGKTLSLGIAHDITERKRMERELQERNEQLDVQNEELRVQSEEMMAQHQELMEKTEEVAKANQLKSEFLANMSHELRTPLNVIIGFSELMIDEVPGKINQEQRQCLSDVLDSSQHLLNLINEVLDLSRIESGKVELKQENVALTEVIIAVSRSMMPILTARKQSLEVEIEKGLPPVYADEGKMGQVLLNLVDNSSKCTPEGGKLKIKAVSDDGWCRVSVIDNGIGIKAEDQERIFEPFCQLENPSTDEKSGTGLGLALVKQIVERYDGRIWVESEYGRGSQFTFTIPLTTKDTHPKERNR